MPLYFYNPFFASEQPHRNDPADNFLKPDHKVHPRDRQTEQVSGQEAQRNAQQPCPHEIDPHDIFCFPAATDDPTAKDHVLHLEGCEYRKGHKQPLRGLQYIVLNIVYTDIISFQQEQ